MRHCHVKTQPVTGHILSHPHVSGAGQQTNTRAGNSKGYARLAGSVFLFLTLPPPVSPSAPFGSVIQIFPPLHSPLSPVGRVWSACQSVREGSTSTAWKPTRATQSKVQVDSGVCSVRVPERRYTSVCLISLQAAGCGSEPVTPLSSMISPRLELGPGEVSRL